MFDDLWEERWTNYDDDYVNVTGDTMIGNLTIPDDWLTAYGVNGTKYYLGNGSTFDAIYGEKDTINNTFFNISIGDFETAFTVFNLTISMFDDLWQNLWAGFSDDFVNRTGGAMTGLLTINDDDGVSGEDMLIVGDSNDKDNIATFGNITLIGTVNGTFSNNGTHIRIGS